jgi:predicted HTH domain antitoxin|tara:strand:+ start:2110 stop:2343 length:234 start_codon:yes stop_codon:yes gene_type:complete
MKKSKKQDWAYSDTKVKVDKSVRINGHKIPDPKLHQQVSFIKSGIRILGYAALWWSIDIAATLLILSEVVGIGEELV